MGKVTLITSSKASEEVNSKKFMYAVIIHLPTTGFGSTSLPGNCEQEYNFIYLNKHSKSYF